MALRGTLTDFGIADIFQLIGMQGKTGILTLDDGEDIVKVYFEQGSVVSADTKLRNLEDLLGSVLVKGGMIREEQLAKALKTQRKTLQRLGYLLLQEQLISPQDLGQALQMQVSQIVFRLFRWREGTYQFEPKQRIEFERDIFEPIQAESLLMEGARMIDEWPLLERRIPYDSMVFARTEAGEAIASRPKPPKAPMITAVAVGETNPSIPEPPPLIDPDWHTLLTRVDGRKMVRELCEMSPMQEFDSYRALVHFISQGWVEEIKSTPNETRDRAGGVASAGLAAIFCLALLVLGIVLLPINPTSPWNIKSVSSVSEDLEHFSSRMRLEHIGRAMRIFYLDTGSLPPSVQVLAANGYLDVKDLKDPWGKPYTLEYVEGGYLLMGTGPDGEPDPSLTFKRTLSPSQRALLGDY